ncbi:MAG: hypothetical protein WB770_04535, partial [Acidimicrobiales bacterium]
MAETEVVPPVPQFQKVRASLRHLRPTWSAAGAASALRAVLVIPSLFAITSQVVHDSQMALFATFGGFASLVIANFGGTRREKLVAHLGLAVAGTVLIPIGTAIHSSAALASSIAVPVVFVVIFFGVVGSNTASGTTAALVAFILPAASPGSVSLLPSRLEGWWLASAAATLAVLAISPKQPADQLRERSSSTLDVLAQTIGRLGSGIADLSLLRKAHEAQDELMAEFRRARRAALSAADLALADLVETVQWCVTLVDDAAKEHGGLGTIDDLNSHLLASASEVLGEAGEVLIGRTAEVKLGALDEQLTEREREIATSSVGAVATEESIHLAFNVLMIAVAARNMAIDALIAARRASRADALRDRGFLAEGPPGAAVSKK